MYHAGRRRILRYIYVGVSSVRPVDDELLAFARELPELAAHPSGRAGDDGATPEALTNVGLYRAYLMGYLATHPKVATDQIWRVTNEDAIDGGLPLLLLAYLTETADVPYRLADAEIYEHALAMAPRFGLRLFQPLSRNEQRDQPAGPLVGR